MPGTVTVTGTAGPGLTITAGVFTGVTFFSINTDNEILELVSNGRTVQVNIGAATTITCTVSGNTYTLTIS
jgi:hypothetical protein